MKRITLELTVTAGFALLVNIRGGIAGNIDPVLELLENTTRKDNVLIDLRSLRCHHGIYELRSCNGFIPHIKVLDILSRQSGVLMLCPGEALSFGLKKQWLHIFNRPRDNKPYMEYIVSNRKMLSYLDRKLLQIRQSNQVFAGWSPSSGELVMTKQ